MPYRHTSNLTALVTNIYYYEYLVERPCLWVQAGM